MSVNSTLTVSGPGLITGQDAQVEIEPAPSGHGIVFEVNGAVIPAHPQAAVNTDRGVTLGSADGKILSIVEHFLSACAITGHTDLRVRVTGAPELPLLDGSAAPWATFLTDRFGTAGSRQGELALQAPVLYQDPRNPGIQCLALPSEQLEITYMVDFPHPDLTRRWFHWSSSTGDLLTDIAPARTFGFVSELPMLQAQGLALGVTPENTLGLTEEGGYTSPLRMPDEPVRHKVLDLIGDLMLCGIVAPQLRARLMIYWGGHTAHLSFGQLLAQALTS